MACRCALKTRQILSAQTRPRLSCSHRWHVCVVCASEATARFHFIGALGHRAQQKARGVFLVP